MRDHRRAPHLTGSATRLAHYLGKVNKTGTLPARLPAYFKHRFGADLDRTAHSKDGVLTLPN
jgi:hypothetical protein